MYSTLSTTIQGAGHLTSSMYTDTTVKRNLKQLPSRRVSKKEKFSNKREIVRVCATLHRKLINAGAMANSTADMLKVLWLTI